LNYHCEAVCDEIKKIFTFWLSKEEAGNNTTDRSENQINSDDNFRFLSEMRQWVDNQYPGSVMLAETNNEHTTPIQVQRYQNIFHLVMDFNFLKHLDHHKASDAIEDLTTSKILKTLYGQTKDELINRSNPPQVTEPF